MDKTEAQEIANGLIARYASVLPLEQTISSLTGVLMVYGVPMGGQIFTRQAALTLLAKVGGQAEKPTAVFNGVRFVASQVWMEGDEKTGKVMVTYTREEK